MMASFFLGVDGGQSSTTALIGHSSGRVLGQGRAGPCNHAAASEGRAKLTRALRDSLARACGEAGLDPDGLRFQGACLGFSGGPEDKESLVAALIPADRLLVTNDARIALTGATAGEPGLIVIAGTGSIALGRNGAGKTARAGGWGYVFGDEGGGFDIARQALRAALRFEEGWGPATTLHRRLLEAAAAPDAYTLLHRFYTPEFPRPAIAGFARLVDEAAEAGDSTAAEILRSAARSLAAFAAAVRGQLFTPAERSIVAPIGGAFRSRTLHDEFRSLVSAGPGNIFQLPRLGPAAGALLEAYRLAGLAPALLDTPEEKR